MSKGFTLIEMIVVIAIIAVLSAIILFSVTQYINKGKDASISGYLSSLIPAGEVWYNGNGKSYEGFCALSVVTNAISQMPQNPSGVCVADNPQGVCCKVESSLYQAWSACVKELANPLMAFCVDSRGVKKEIDAGSCTSEITKCDN